MAKLTKEQMREIVEGAPKGATHYSLFERCFYKCHNNEWMYCIERDTSFKFDEDGLAPDDICNLSDLRTILAQHEEIERLRGEIDKRSNTIQALFNNLIADGITGFSVSENGLRVFNSHEIRKQPPKDDE